MEWPTRLCSISTQNITQDWKIRHWTCYTPGCFALRLPYIFQISYLVWRRWHSRLQHWVYRYHILWQNSLRKECHTSGQERMSLDFTCLMWNPHNHPPEWNMVDLSDNQSFLFHTIKYVNVVDSISMEYIDIQHHSSQYLTLHITLFNRLTW